ncbi:DarT ssDNA thymidine ADP-ribosyltransferase family protein [Pseudomonas sp. NPDC089554]|uniref:DarT ssDNA thymidine ADP-ribosyltransferase family protein n=1 Tax=Pseudomonas sp. NPDC089554 TaxID=3390653 RepID=UPI003CFFA2D9
MTIREKSFIYHLTSFHNIASILQSGLQPRSALQGAEFRDVADANIIEGRRGNALEDFVPFHWFARNPFDGRVQLDRPDEHFLLIAVYRRHAQAQDWRVIPRHPLADGQFELLGYDAGFAAIDWNLMEQRDYTNAACRHVCMAECLSPIAVPPSDFAKIYTPSDEIKRDVEGIARVSGNARLWIEAAPHMFSPR